MDLVGLFLQQDLVGQLDPCLLVGPVHLVDPCHHEDLEDPCHLVGLEDLEFLEDPCHLVYPVDQLYLFRLEDLEFLVGPEDLLDLVYLLDLVHH